MVWIAPGPEALLDCGHCSVRSPENYRLLMNGGSWPGAPVRRTGIFDPLWAIEALGS